MSLGLLVIPGSAQTDEYLPENFPPITTKVMGETGEGYIYIANLRGLRPDDIPAEEWIRYGLYLMVLDNDGSPIFYKALDWPGIRRGYNFRSYPKTLPKKLKRLQAERSPAA